MKKVVLICACAALLASCNKKNKSQSESDIQRIETVATETVTGMSVNDEDETVLPADETKSKEVVTKHVKEKMKKDKVDENKYESVSWNTIRSVYQPVNLDPMYISLKKALDAKMDSINNFENLPLPSGLNVVVSEIEKSQVEKRYEEAKAKLDEFSANYKPKFYGYEVEHTYKIPNKKGVMELHKDTFIVDRNYTKILERL